MATYASWRYSILLLVHVTLTYSPVCATVPPPTPTTPTTPPTPPPTTPPPTTVMITTRPLPPNACFYEGRFYADNQIISSGECSGLICISGQVAAWDDPCAFGTTTPRTTIPPTPRRTTTPPVPPGSCVYNNVIYADGAEIERDQNNCYGLQCSGGSLMYWDDICFINTPPPCYGWEEDIPGQCCPLCHVTPTTTPPPTTTPTTTRPLPYCFFNGKLYKNYEIFDLDANGCHGKECLYGVARPWKMPCSVDPADCDGNLRNVTNECCLICEVSVDDNTTTTVRTTTTTTTTTTATTTSTREPVLGCQIGTDIYSIGSRTNTDACYKCFCTTNGEVCSRTICNDITDCRMKYRPKGECCFTCGTAETLQISTILVLLTLAVQLAGLN